MINKKDNPVEWAILMYEVSDAHEHLNELIKEMQSEDNFDENDFSIQIKHILSHLNRSYNSRNHIGEIDYDIFEKYSNCPDDFKKE